MHLTKTITDNGTSWTAFANYTKSKGQYDVKLGHIAFQHGLMPKGCTEDDSNNGVSITLSRELPEGVAEVESENFQTEVTKVMDSLEKFKSMLSATEEYKAK